MITLKNIRHSKFASQETHCFVATVYFNGKKCGIVSNDGLGGCDSHEIQDRAQWGLMEAHIKTLKTRQTSIPDFEMDETLETICCDLINDHLAAKELKAKLRTRGVFLNENGELFQSCVIKDKNQLLEYCESRSTRNEWKFLNLMPFDKALAIWRNS